MFKLPPPTSFAEGQRQLYGCLVAMAGMFAGAVALGYTAFFVLAVWLKIIPPALDAQIVTILGYGLAGFIGAMICVIVTLAVGGPVGRFKGGGSLKDGINFEVSDQASAVASAAEGAAKGAATAVANATVVATPVAKPSPDDGNAKPPQGD